MSLDPRTNPLAYIARCDALRRRGLPAGLVTDLRDAMNEQLLAELEAMPSHHLAEVARLYEAREAAVEQLAAAAARPGHSPTRRRDHVADWDALSVLLGGTAAVFMVIVLVLSVWWVQELVR